MADSGDAMLSRPYGRWRMRMRRIGTMPCTCWRLASNVDAHRKPGYHSGVPDPPFRSRPVFDYDAQIAQSLHEGDFAAAEQLLAQRLSLEPGDAPSRSLRALCLGQLERPAEALREARRAVRDEPDSAYCHRVLALLFADQDRYGEAVEAARTALSLDPDDAEAHAVISRARAASGDWHGALVAAEEGLECEPDHPGCANLRALALQRVGSPEAEQAFIDAAATDPENAFARAGRGWTALHSGGGAQAALPHFYHALEIDPSLQWARDGAQLALKSRNPLYRVMMRYFLWMDSLPAGSRWTVMLGGLVGYNVLQRLVREYPAIAPVAYPVMALYLLFVLTTWVADPLSDAVVWLDPKGRQMMPGRRAAVGAIVAALLVAGLGVCLAGVFTDDSRLMLVALALAVMVIPVTGTSRMAPGWPQRLLAAWTALAGVLLLTGAALPGEDGTALLLIAILAGALSSWLTRLFAGIGHRTRTAR